MILNLQTWTIPRTFSFIHVRPQRITGSLPCFHCRFQFPMLLSFPQYKLIPHSEPSGGASVAEAFAWAGLAMNNYMTPLKGVQVREANDRRLDVTAHDMQSLLFAFLDQLLFTFSTDLFVAKEILITRFERGAVWRIAAIGRAPPAPYSRPSPRHTPPYLFEYAPHHRPLLRLRAGSNDSLRR